MEDVFKEGPVTDFTEPGRVAQGGWGYLEGGR